MISSTLKPSSQIPVFLIYYDLLNGPASKLKPILKLVFSTAVSPSGFKMGAVRLHAGRSATDISMSIEGESVENDAFMSNILLITFTRTDVVRLKAADGLARSKDTTFLSLPSNTIFGASGEPVTEIAVNKAQPVRLYDLEPISFLDTPTVDLGNQNLLGGNGSLQKVPPLLTGIGLNMNAMQLSLSFLEPVDPATLRLETLKLQSAEFNLDNYYKFTAKSGRVILPKSSGPNINVSNIMIQLTTRTMNEIKLITGLAISRESSIIAADSGLVQDYYGAAAEAIPARQVEAYTADVSQPTLIAFTVDMGSGMVSLSFSEPMEIDNASLISIRFQNSAAKATAMYGLTGGYIRNDGQTLEGDSAVMELYMAAADLKHLQEDNTLLESVDSTFITLKGNSFYDRSKNALEVIRMSNAMQAKVVYLATVVASDNDKRKYSSTTKALIGSAMSFVLLLIFIVVFIAPRWNSKHEYSPKLWEQKMKEQSKVAGPLTAPGNELEWDAHVDKTRYADPNSSRTEEDIIHATTAFTYAAVQDNELTITRGEIVIIQPESEGCPPGWCYATNMQHETGLVQLAMLHLTEPISENIVDLSLPNYSQTSDSPARFLRSPDVEGQKLQSPTSMLSDYDSDNGIQLRDRRRGSHATR